MLVTKRSGHTAEYSSRKIHNSLSALCNRRNIKCYPNVLTNDISIQNETSTSSIVGQLALHSSFKSLANTEYGKLATAISVANLHKTVPTFEECSRILLASNLVTAEYKALLKKYMNVLEKEIDYSLDYEYDYAALSILKMYSLFDGKFQLERPQSALMRLSLNLHGDDTENVLRSYRMLSRKLIIHGMPTHKNCGVTNKMASCVLIYVDAKDDVSIFEAVKTCGELSLSSCGIGLHVSSFASSPSCDLMSMLRMFDSTLSFCKNRGDSRKGANAPYCEPWHINIEQFIDLKLNEGIAKNRLKNLFYGLWCPDLFMERVVKNENFSLFCPSTAPGLDECYGEKFNQLYTKYETQGLALKTLRARELWVHILKNAFGSGVPYICFKDNVNRASNQKHLGCIKGSNLCTEIMQYTDKHESAMCNLASVCLVNCIEDGVFNFQILFDAVEQIVKNLNKVIDKTVYINDKLERSNTRHRTMGIGVSGLIDTFISLNMEFESAEARKLNHDIFETIYYAAVRTSCDLAKVDGYHPSFPGSDLSMGIFHFQHYPNTVLTGRWDFESLRKDVILYGTRNMLFVAPMPTSTASIVCGVNESCEPYVSNVYIRKTGNGESVYVNKLLQTRLEKEGIWSHEVSQKLIDNSGEIDNVDEIPDNIKRLFKTVWNIPSKALVDMYIDRQRFVDQAQSFSIFMPNIDIEKLSNILIYAWKNGLKTGMYYLRMKPPKIEQKMTPKCSGCVV